MSKLFSQTTTQAEMVRLRMTKEEHRARHQRLHEALDELAADYLAHHPLRPSLKPKMPSTTTLAELMTWSHQQTIDPEDLP
jgi:hypothetical protein